MAVEGGVAAHSPRYLVLAAVGSTYLRLVDIDALLRCDDGACAQHLAALCKCNVLAPVGKEPAVGIHKVAVGIGKVDMLHMLRYALQPLLVADYQQEGIETCPGIALPAVVDLSPTVAPLVEHPAGIEEELFLEGAVVLRCRHLANIAEPVGIGTYLALYILDSLLAAVEVLQVDAIVYPLIARVAHNAETVGYMAIGRHMLEAHRYILPRAVEVLIGERIGFVELIALVLVEYLVVELPVAHCIEHETELLPFGRQHDAVQHGVLEVHIHTHRIALVAHHGIELANRTLRAGHDHKRQTCRNH